MALGRILLSVVECPDAAAVGDDSVVVTDATSFDPLLFGGGLELDDGCCFIFFCF